MFSAFKEFARRMEGLPRVERILALIGRMVMTWNEAELVWYLIYTCMVHQLPREVADTIIKRHLSNSQRDLTLALAEVVLREHPDIFTFLEKAKTETNNLALERNDIIHGDYRYSIDEPFVTPPHEFRVALRPGDDRNKKRNIFAGKNLDEELPPLIADIERLVTQLDQARHHLLWRIIPPAQRPQPLPESMPDDLRVGLLQSHPELKPPSSELTWRSIRPTARPRG
jgi:hypothetical protein